MTERTQGALYDSEAALRLVDSTLQDLTGVSSEDITAAMDAGGAGLAGECRDLLEVLASVRARLDGAILGASPATGALVSDHLAQARAGLYQAERCLWPLARPAEDESVPESSPAARAL
jgi:hypothetical protein